MHSVRTDSMTSITSLSFLMKDASNGKNQYNASRFRRGPFPFMHDFIVPTHYRDNYINNNYCLLLQMYVIYGIDLSYRNHIKHRHIK
jgi:hypothetical protein